MRQGSRVSAMAGGALPARRVGSDWGVGGMAGGAARVPRTLMYISMQIIEEVSRWGR